MGWGEVRRALVNGAVVTDGHGVEFGCVTGVGGNSYRVRRSDGTWAEVPEAFVAARDWYGVDA